MELFGFYSMFVYLTGILGGFIGDKYLGVKSSILWGCSLQCIGHFLLTLTIFFDKIISIMWLNKPYKTAQEFYYSKRSAPLFNKHNKGSISTNYLALHDSLIKH